MLKKLTPKNILTFLGLISCLVWLAVFSFPDNRLHVIFCDVGQGDATLITKGFNQILIDAGPNDKVLTCLKNNLPFWDKKIEITILTHPEADHMTGFIAVLDKYDIGYFLLGPEEGNSAVFGELVKKIKSRGFCKVSPCSTAGRDLMKTTKIVNPYSGDKIKLGGITLTSLWPDREWVAERIDNSVIASETKQSRSGLPRPDLVGARNDNDSVLGLKTTHSKLNDFSLVFLLTYNSKRILLMGDADERVHNKFIDNLTALPIDILKFPHHGSKTGMEKDTLMVLKPKEAVISVGKNSYGHPTSEALEMLNSVGVKARRTDLEGEIKYSF